MKAIVQDRFGSPDSLQFIDVDTPAVGDNDVLVKVVAAGINPQDWHLMRGEPRMIRLDPVMGLRTPKNRYCGTDVAGHVEAVGTQVTNLRPGDEVFGWGRGTLAEFACAAEDKLTKKPAGLTFEQAAAVPLAALTALQGLRDKGNIRQGQQVLINGASGGVGTFAVQIAKSLGAEVTGVCSARNLDLVRSIGADHVIDYTNEDFTRNGQRYDLIFDTAGNRSLREYRRALAAKGTLVLAGAGGGRWVGPVPQLVRAAVLSRFVSQQLRPFVPSATPNKADLEVLAELLESKQLVPVIDRTYSLSEAAEGIRYLELGHARGKVVVTI